jgi:hypothetical protein
MYNIVSYVIFYIFLYLFNILSILYFIFIFLFLHDYISYILYISCFYIFYISLHIYRTYLYLYFVPFHLLYDEKSSVCSYMSIFIYICLMYNYIYLYCIFIYLCCIHITWFIFCLYFIDIYILFLHNFLSIFISLYLYF